MTLTPREIQEKQFHDAFRGYNHEEVDLFIDQVAEAYETLYKENQNFHRRLAELEDRLKNAQSAPAAAPAPAAPRSESEDMLKRMLVTAQETADKAVANARAKAQMLVDEAELKARRIEEQADAVSSTTLQDAQRRARDLLQTAQQEEAELRDRIEGLKTFERDFRLRLTAFIRSQLELLETKPAISAGGTGPVTSPFFDRSKLLSESIEKFGDFGVGKPAEAPARDSLVEAPAPSEPEPAAETSTPDWLSSISPAAEPAADLEPARPVPDWPTEDFKLPEPEPAPQPEAQPSPGVSVGAVSSGTAEEAESSAKKRSAASETKSIHELFWGED